MPDLTPQTRDFLLSMLDQLTIQASHPQFEEMAATIVQARRELQALLEKPAPNRQTRRAQERVNGKGEAEAKIG